MKNEYTIWREDFTVGGLSKCVFHLARKGHKHEPSASVLVTGCLTTARMMCRILRAQARNK